VFVTLGFIFFFCLSIFGLIVGYNTQDEFESPERDKQACVTFRRVFVCPFRIKRQINSVTDA
jgi:hypothetical protein